MFILCFYCTIHNHTGWTPLSLRCWVREACVVPPLLLPAVALIHPSLVLSLSCADSSGFWALQLKVDFDQQLQTQSCEFVFRLCPLNMLCPWAQQALSWQPRSGRRCYSAAGMFILRGRDALWNSQLLVSTPRFAVYLNASLKSWHVAFK